MPMLLTWVEAPPRLPGFAPGRTGSGEHVASATELVAPRSVLPVTTLDVPSHVRPLHDTKEVLLASCEEEQSVVNRSEASARAVRSRSPPDDLVLEVGRAEYRVHQHLEIVTRG